ncbi:TRAP transporter small permease [Planomicrobium sp. CPCC 101079]|uniref:TRAP transporter small permease n=1 Tax=Planomicrobium sp. CPCC 101079 TaxID=2599618 RepID=UPI0011B6A1EF|nr:TRAP transporter small permease [Planomicrobium sp. CPCC 101079]TWT01765.1 TRAP transporter small permease [Planomicrobium sp. CPCC 101079]
MQVVKSFTDNIEKFLCVVLLAFITAIMTINILMLIIADSALAWASEAVLTLFVFFVWVGISYGFKERKHIRVTALVDILPTKAQKILELFVNLLILAFFAIILVVGFQWMSHPSVVTETSLLLRYPMWLLYLAAPLGALLSVIRITQNFIQDMKTVK